MRSDLRPFLVLSGLAAVAVWLTRPLLLPDELRYLTVAWEMWDRGSFLVPLLNGEPYSHKPPFLFWGFHAGWAVFGVNAWWPRLFCLLGGVAFVTATARLARRLAPDLPTAGTTCFLLLGGTLAVQVYASMLLFDLWLAAFVVLGWHTLLDAAEPGRALRGWAAFGVAAGLAMLVKGPAALVTLLPPAVLAAWWRRGRLPRSWWPGLAAGTALGAAIVLSWALPAARAGGPEYADAILWGQTAGRVTQSFAHSRPLWWYLPLLPVMTFPWVVWPAVWRGRPILPHPDATRALTRFGLAGFVLPLLVFSLVDGKQPHYLVPALAGLALAAAPRLLPPTTGRRRWFALAFVPAAVLFAFLPRILEAEGLRPDPELAPYRLHLVAAAVALGLSLSALLGERSGRRTVHPAAAARFVPTLFLLAAVGAVPLLAWRYDLTEPAEAFARAERLGRDRAVVGIEYHGEFGFLARLREPVASPQTPAAIRAWLRAHPEALVGVVHKPDDPNSPGPGPEGDHPFGTKTLSLWPAKELAATGYPAAAREDATGVSR